VSLSIAEGAARRQRQQTAPSARRAGWISIGMIVFLFSAIILATQPGDDSINSEAGTAAAEMHVPAVLRVVAHVIGWEQNRHG
jgi:hypothetical protein